MNLALWIVAIILALVFAGSGITKLTMTKEKMASAGQEFAGAIGQSNIRIIGIAEILGAIGLIAPAVTGIAPRLVPAAATGFVLLMIGAAIFHARRGELSKIAVNMVLLALAAFVAWGRFGAHPFAAS